MFNRKCIKNSQSMSQYLIHWFFSLSHQPCFEDAVQWNEARRAVKYDRDSQNFPWVRVNVMGIVFMAILQKVWWILIKRGSKCIYLPLPWIQTLHPNWTKKKPSKKNTAIYNKNSSTQSIRIFSNSIIIYTFLQYSLSIFIYIQVRSQCNAI